MLRANAAVLALASSLNKDDILNLVTTNSEVAVVHRIAASTGGLALLQLDPPLQIGGAGSLQTGVDRAYAAATTDESLLPNGLNRLVVITDGGGLADAIAPGPLRGQWTSNRIQLVGVGVGNAKSYRNEVLGAATDAGHGANIYLDSVKEAVPALHDRFDEIMDEAGGEVTIGVAVPSLLDMVELDPSGAIVTESHLLKSDLGRGRSMVFRRFVRVCDPDSVALLGLTLDITLAWNDPVTGERKSRVDHIKVGDAVQANSAGGSFPLLKTSAILAFGNALKSLDSARFKDACVKLAAARNAMSSTGPSAPVDPELDSILAQIQRHPVMTKANLKCP